MGFRQPKSRLDDPGEIQTVYGGELIGLLVSTDQPVENKSPFFRSLIFKPDCAFRRLCHQDLKFQLSGRRPFICALRCPQRQKVNGELTDNEEKLLGELKNGLTIEAGMKRTPPVFSRVTMSKDPNDLRVFQDQYLNKRLGGISDIKTGGSTSGPMRIFWRLERPGGENIFQETGFPADYMPDDDDIPNIAKLLAAKYGPIKVFCEAWQLDSDNHRQKIIGQPIFEGIVNPREKEQENAVVKKSTEVPIMNQRPIPDGAQMSAKRPLPAKVDKPLSPNAGNEPIAFKPQAKINRPIKKTAKKSGQKTEPRPMGRKPKAYVIQGFDEHGETVQLARRICFLPDAAQLLFETEKEKNAFLQLAYYKKGILLPIERIKAYWYHVRRIIATEKPPRKCAIFRWIEIRPTDGSAPILKKVSYREAYAQAREVSEAKGCDVEYYHVNLVNRKLVLIGKIESAKTDLPEMASSPLPVPEPELGVDDTGFNPMEAVAAKPEDELELPASVEAKALLPVRGKHSRSNIAAVCQSINEQTKSLDNGGGICVDNPAISEIGLQIIFEQSGKQPVSLKTTAEVMELIKMNKSRSIRKKVLTMALDLKNTEHVNFILQNVNIGLFLQVGALAAAAAV